MARNLPTFFTIFTVSLILNFRKTFSIDEGIVLAGAHNLLIGGQIYKDFYTFVTPGSFYFVSIFFRLFGENYTSALVPSIMLQAMSTMFVFLLTRELVSTLKYPFIAAAIWFFIFSFTSTPISYHTYSVAISCAAIYFLLSGIRNKNTATLLLSSLMFGLNIFVFQPSAILTAFAITTTASLCLKKQLGFKIFAVFLLLCALPLLVLFTIAKPSLILDQLIIWPLANDIDYSLLNPYQYTGLIAVVLALFSLAGKRSNMKPKYLVLTFVFQVLLFTSTITRRDIQHLALNAITIPISLTILLNNFSQSKSIPHLYKLVANIIFLIFLSVIVVFKIMLNYEMTKGYSLIKKQLEPYKNTNFYAHPFMPNLYMELNSKDIYPYSFVLTESHDATKLTTHLEYIKKVNPQYIFVDYNTIKNLNYNTNNILDNYINSNYVETTRFNNIKVLSKL